MAISSVAASTRGREVGMAASVDGRWPPVKTTRRRRQGARLLTPGRLAAASKQRGHGTGASAPALLSTMAADPGRCRSIQTGPHTEERSSVRVSARHTFLKRSTGR